jgi:uncharacterized protein (TIGR00255 family)
LFFGQKHGYFAWQFGNFVGGNTCTQMKSMTGYGRGEGTQSGFKVTVELSSVNRKQGEISLGLPRELEPLEALFRDEINKRIARGRLTVRVSLHTSEGQSLENVRLNLTLAREYARVLTQLSRELGLESGLSLELVARAPGVMQTNDPQTDAQEFWPPAQKALRQALTCLLAMREREGIHLCKDLCHRVAVMKKSVSRIQKQAPKAAKRYQDQLRTRLLEAGCKESAIDEQRLLQEVIIFADRIDISEELTRLQSHFKQFAEGVKTNEPVGRMLDFLAQEMNREVNTIGAKANDSLISQEVVRLKAEVEKFREQVQNVE